MNITIKTDILTETGAEDGLAFTFNTVDLVKIVKNSGLEAGNNAIDKLVENYTLKLKEKLSKVINK